MTDISEELVEWFTVNKREPVMIPSSYYELLLAAHPSEVVRLHPDKPSETMSQIAYQALLKQAYASEEPKQILPFCAYCKTPRVNGEWLEPVNPLEELQLMVLFNLSHGGCPPCIKKVYEEDFD